MSGKTIMRGLHDGNRPGVAVELMRQRGIGLRSIVALRPVDGAQ